ncbi:LOW QUALITY PROTEIN: uncharacterized protein EMH_0073650 [Eimeria mitis]|uniref:Uncharacterized protein n=1 Tax=Eimeria mitis TaxID=44415 RepID=U6K5V2_9EIME|nr:LOW QUALITY PROTEIN: uncharacterized protein EMH_0073650 [Eimeria mitis]CDJ32246.1 hypothetical protein, conserved [Eimeria mitis]
MGRSGPRKGRSAGMKRFASKVAEWEEVVRERGGVQSGESCGDVAESNADQASREDPPGQRVDHQTRVPIGVASSPHYKNPNKYYDFPRLGDSFQKSTILDFLMQEFHALVSGVDYRHLKRDVACVAEEMILAVLAEAEDTGIPNGETTRLVFEMEKPKGVNSKGGVRLEVYASKAPDFDLMVGQ